MHADILRPMGADERELEVAVKFGLPEVYGFAAKVEARYARSRSSRQQEALKVVCREARVTPEDLVAEIEGSDRLSDAFSRTWEAIASTADPLMRDLLARLLSAALDDSKLDETAYVLAICDTLRPIHLRILWLGWDIEPWAMEPRHSGNDPRYINTRIINQATVLPALKVRAGITNSAMKFLVNSDLLERRSSSDPSWIVTELTQTLFSMAFPRSKWRLQLTNSQAGHSR